MSSRQTKVARMVRQWPQRDSRADWPLASGSRRPRGGRLVDFVARQERLGPEFEKVLFDNLWELYAR